MPTIAPSVTVVVSLLTPRPAESVQAFVEGLTDLPADARERLLALTPGGYTGLAADLARKS